jgi:hypothetical protein
MKPTTQVLGTQLRCKLQHVNRKMLSLEIWRKLTALAYMLWVCVYNYFYNDALFFVTWHVICRSFVGGFLFRLNAV